ncbi:MAG: hypothetical protein MUE37_02410 [Bacteroidales bacterium]|jgi:hypothetical protein|nr:hypothetical protein [Bacteroidales bacterium]
MKTVMIIALMGIICSLPVRAQVSSTITVEKKGLAKHYIQNGERLDHKEIRSVLSGYPGSADEFKKSSRNSGIGLGLVAGGCLVIGANSIIGTIKDLEALNSGSMNISGSNTGIFLAGCGMAVAGIPFLLRGNSQFIRSINLYNSQPGLSHSPGTSIVVAVTPVSAGLKICF